jgi:superfamily II DNA or RNA helicase
MSEASAASTAMAAVRLRPYQVDAVTRIEGTIAAGVRRLVLVLPTGGGKTTIAGSLILRAVERGQRVLFLAHRRELIVQAYQRLLDMGLSVEQVGIVMASDRRRRPGAAVQIASIDTLRRRARPLADVVFVDECHRALAASYREIATDYPDASHLGLTATPYRADGKGLGDAYDELITVATPRQLIGEGYLVEPRVFTVPPSQRPNLTGIRVARGDYAARDLDEAMNRQALVGNIVEHWQRHAGGVRTVVFAVSVAHSRHITERFREAGVVAEHLDGATPTPERDAILARLDRGETLVVSNVGVCTEGWDCLDAATEILTPAGWRGMGKVARGDSVYALNPQTDKLEVVPADDYGERTVRAGEQMLRIRSQHVDIRTTAGHRFYLRNAAGGYDVRTGSELARDGHRFTLPLAAPRTDDLPGVPLTDDELRFVAWFMTDGGFEARGARVGITQAKAFHNEIRALLVRLGLDFREYLRPFNTGTFGGNLPVHRFYVPKGTRTGSLARRGWFERFAPYLDKEVAAPLHEMTPRQFGVFWAELLKGDGEQPDKSGWLWCDRHEQVDAYMRMAAERGLASTVSARTTAMGRTVYRVSIRDRRWICSAPHDLRSAFILLEEPAPDERVWCVSNRLGTLVTRRGGRSVILGNCPPVKCAVLARPTKSTGLYLQQAGRILRPWKDTAAVILDHAGCALEHGLPQDERVFSLDGAKRRRAPRDATAPVRECPSCFLVSSLATRVCPACGELLVASREPPEEVAGELIPAEDTRAPPADRAPSASRDVGLTQAMRAAARASGGTLRWELLDALRGDR